MSSKINQGMFSRNTSEWYTPREIIDTVISVFSGTIDLDPCSNSHENPNVPAIKHFTKEDNGLNQNWYGRIFMNPPFKVVKDGKDVNIIPEWVKKLICEYTKGKVEEAIVLVPVRSDTVWWFSLCRYPWCGIKGRLHFSNSENSAPFPSAVFYLGENYENFKAAFEELGIIYNADPNQKVLRESGEQQTLSQIFEQEDEACRV